MTTAIDGAAGRRRRAAAAVAVAALLSACASVPTEPAAGLDKLSGRLAVKIDADAEANLDARSVTAAFDLLGNPEAGRLDLATPLGNVLARARWSPGRVVLATPQGERAFADLDALTAEVLGESLPVAALFDWLRGRPWPGAPSRPRVAPEPPGFEQLGWLVDLAGLAEQRIVARRARPPAVTVRAQLEAP